MPERDRDVLRDRPVRERLREPDLASDGFDLLRRVRALEGGSARTPAIAVTAYARDDDKARALKAGFDAHVSKPMSANELLAVVEQLIGTKN